MNLFSQLDLEPTYEDIAPGAVLMRSLLCRKTRSFWLRLIRLPRRLHFIQQ